MRVAKHKSKLRGFNFSLTYEPGTTAPVDYGSRHPSPKRAFTPMEKENLGVEGIEEDAKIIVNQINEINDTIMFPILNFEKKIRGVCG